MQRCCRSIFVDELLVLAVEGADDKTQDLLNVDLSETNAGLKVVGVSSDRVAQGGSSMFEGEPVVWKDIDGDNLMAWEVERPYFVAGVCVSS